MRKHDDKVVPSNVSIDKIVNVARDGCSAPCMSDYGTALQLANISSGNEGLELLHEGIKSTLESNEVLVPICLDHIDQFLNYGGIGFHWPFHEYLLPCFDGRFEGPCVAIHSDARYHEVDVRVVGDICDVLASR